MGANYSSTNVYNLDFTTNNWAAPPHIHTSGIPIIDSIAHNTQPKLVLNIIEINRLYHHFSAPLGPDINPFSILNSGRYHISKQRQNIKYQAQIGPILGPKCWPLIARIKPKSRPKDYPKSPSFQRLEPNSRLSIWVQKVKGVNSVLGGKGKRSQNQPQKQAQFSTTSRPLEGALGGENNRYNHHQITQA